MESLIMKLIKNLAIGLVITSALFGTQSFARGGGGGGGGGMHGGGGFASGGRGFAVGARGASAGAVGFGARGAGERSGIRDGFIPVASGAFDREHNRHNHRFFGDGFGYIDPGYWNGYGWDGDTDSLVQPVDNSLPDYEQAQDKRRAALPSSEFVKTYGTVRPASIAHKQAGMQL
jgi:hypothetical protein